VPSTPQSPGESYNKVDRTLIIKGVTAIERQGAAIQDFNDDWLMKAEFALRRPCRRSCFPSQANGVFAVRNFFLAWQAAVCFMLSIMLMVSGIFGFRVLTLCMAVTVEAVQTVLPGIWR